MEGEVRDTATSAAAGDKHPSWRGWRGLRGGCLRLGGHFQGILQSHTTTLCATKRKSTGEEWALAHGLEGLPREHHLRAPPPAGQVMEGECPCPVPNEGRGEQSCG